MALGVGHFIWQIASANIGKMTLYYLVPGRKPPELVKIGRMGGAFGETHHEWYQRVTDDGFRLAAPPILRDGGFLPGTTYQIMTNYHPRALGPRLREALDDLPVVVVTGLRQTGKSPEESNMQLIIGNKPHVFRAFRVFRVFRGCGCGWRTATCS
jgi:hypothetical protein